MSLEDPWPEPRYGLDEEYAAWNWIEESRTYHRPTDHPPNRVRGWGRWYFVYSIPGDGRIKISADRDPVTGRWYNPHESSDQP